MDIEPLVWRLGGVVRRTELLTQVSRHQVDNAIKRGRLVAVLPGILVHGAYAEDESFRLRALTAYVEGKGALSHLTGLRVWALIDRVSGPDHVTVTRGRRLACRPDLVVHEHSAATAATMRIVRRNGLCVVDLETALVTSWPLLSEAERRAPAIVAVRERMTTPERLTARARSLTRQPGRGEVLGLCGLLAEGAQSEFEIWGVQHMFDADLLNRSRGQLPIRVGSRTFYIDRGFEAELVAVELDGTRWHDMPSQREADRQRDEALARLGWLTVRMSYRRVVEDPAGARASLHEILRTRQVQLGLRPPDCVRAG